jgi:general stress protein YciG
MAQERAQKSTSNRGFASMDQEKQREIARKGGANVPNEKRSFSQNRELAAEAGRKGGVSRGRGLSRDAEARHAETEVREPPERDPSP